MKRFFVASYSDERSEMYYDIVISDDKEQAQSRVWEGRPYVEITGEPLTVDEIDKIHAAINEKTDAQIEATFQRMLKESL